ncbi:alkaline phosphatase family protein [Haloechinothrix salitolerans]|uniref:Alkaline phosphatase family protein n=1 Tax=Haloechinothrix salitolerans TaxID=926830 RepID=A0ABW2C8J3_9PSEU
MSVDRRTFLRATVTGGTVLLSAAMGTGFAQGGERRRRVYVVVLDGLRPDEVSPTLTPNLTALKAAGTWFGNARSLPIMETIPNHVMMMSGVRPDRSGVPANAVYDRDKRVIRDLDRASDLRGSTMLDRVRERGLRSGTVLSKEYLYGIFGERATYRWEPGPIVPISGHAPDAFTADAAIAMIDEADPDLLFCNLGDCDRVGHADLTGTTLALARTAAVRTSDDRLGAIVSHLKDTGRWQHSVLFVLADHSMDWSVAWQLVSLQPVVDADPMLAGNVVIAQNGGADLLYWTGPIRDREAATRRMLDVVTDVPGVLSAHRPGQLGLGREAGDVVVYCEAGWRFSDPKPWSNPIPGNHGHPATEPIPFLISGGDPVIRGGHASSAQAYTIDVAPTVGALFGLSEPSGGYDGEVRAEAFTRAPVATDIA